jgi:type VI secretion system secreted protein VgrG
MPLSQDKQPISVQTPLGKDVLVFWRMDGTEALSQPFAYELQMLSDNRSLKPKDLLGKTVQIRMQLPGQNSFRFFHGYVTRFNWVRWEGEFSVYQATVHPWLWFLTRASDCRIFQQKSVPDIIKQVFGDLGFSAYVKDSLSGTYATVDYCVQYRESTFNFVSRLMEREGIYYYFTHEDGKHTLVLADAQSSHQTVTGYETVPYFPPDEHRRRSRDHFHEWSFGEHVDTGKVSLNDFNFENPNGSLLSSGVMDRKHPLSTFEMYDYPGGYLITDSGNTYATVRVTERQARYDLVRGAGDVLGAACGALFTLSQAPVDSQNRQYLTLSVSFQMGVAGYSSSGLGQETSYACQVEAIPSSQQFRPARVTPPALVCGVQTAKVVGPSGEEIYTDKYGRIKVQFHWDRLGQSDENSSCWIRVSQTWAGKNWGAIHIPRIGQEVIVDFLEGDPDRPIVTGCVYNADQMPPYTLPDNMTQSGLKSRSTKQGSADNFNELRFEDKKDSEEVYFHAEKDFNRVVENNDTEKIGYGKKDKGDQTIEVFNNQKLVVGGGGNDADDGSQTIEVLNNRTTTIKQGNETLEVQKGHRAVTVKKGDESLVVSEGNRTVTVSKGNDSHTISQGNRDVKIDAGNDTLTITQGNQSIKITAGSCKIEAGQSIELVVGSSSIKIEPAKITLKSAEIAVQADMKVGAKGAMIEINASGALTLKGGITKIN